MYTIWISRRRFETRVERGQQEYLGVDGRIQLMWIKRKQGCSVDYARLAQEQDLQRSCEHLDFIKCGDFLTCCRQLTGSAPRSQVGCYSDRQELLWLAYSKRLKATGSSRGNVTEDAQNHPKLGRLHPSQSLLVRRQSEPERSKSVAKRCNHYNLIIFDIGILFFASQNSLLPRAFSLLYCLSPSSSPFPFIGRVSVQK